MAKLVCLQAILDVCQKQLKLQFVIKKNFESNHISHGVTAKEKWDYDRARALKIQQSENVVRFLVVWESDFRKNPEQLVNNIIKAIL